ncbi:hypothetical protein Plhal304r1_c063g0151031 [Plasmopara halstedii]
MSGIVYNRSLRCWDRTSASRFILCEFKHRYSSWPSALLKLACSVFEGKTEWVSRPVRTFDTVSTITLASFQYLRYILLVGCVLLNRSCCKCRRCP